jgi:site-specific DNA-cytosine methylase
MRYLSVCSGIEAATAAWHHLGWKPVAFSEIDKFPSAVLTHHYPKVPNLGDMTKYMEWKPYEKIDLLVGGTPCQSFSIAGLRKGLEDPRGNLMLTYLAIAARYQPRWMVWENVPGVLSSNGGRDFGTFLGALGSLGYGFAFRVLDAQWFGVAQRRRRVFVVGCLGDAGRAAKVLFESESLSRHPAPSREAGKRVAATLTGGFGERGVDSDQIANGNYAVAACLRSGGNGGVPSSRGEHLVVGAAVSSGNGYWLDAKDKAATIRAQDSITKADTLIVSDPKIKWQSPNGKDIVGAMRARDYKGIGNDDLTEGRGLAVAYAFEPGIAGREGNPSRFTEEVAGTLRQNMGDNQTAVSITQVIPLNTMTIQGRPSDDLAPRMGSGIGKVGDPCPTLSKGHSHAVAIGTDCYNGAVTGDVSATITSSTGSSAAHSGPTVMQPVLGTDCYNGSITGDVAATMGTSGSSVNASGPTVMHAFRMQAFGEYADDQTASAMKARDYKDATDLVSVTTMKAVGTDMFNGAITGDVAVPMTNRADGTGTGPTVMQAMAVRRLTPIECERLQGFPDDYTQIPWNKKPADQCPDGVRYKALGNSMAVPVMRWIGERINKFK